MVEPVYRKVVNVDVSQAGVTWRAIKDAISELYKAPSLVSNSSVDRLVGGNISRERLKAAGVSKADIRKYDKDRNGFDLYELRMFLGDSKEIDALNIGSLQIELVTYKDGKLGEGNSLSEIARTVSSSEWVGVKELNLKDLRGYFKVQPGIYHDYINGRLKFNNTQEFRIFIARIFDPSQTHVGSNSSVGDNLNDAKLNAMIDKTYTKFVSRDPSKAGSLNDNEFAAAVLDLVFGENSYDQLKKKNGYRYLDKAQTEQLAQVLNGSGRLAARLEASQSAALA